MDVSAAGRAATLANMHSLLNDTTSPAWEPIETAPKDGTRVLAINSNRDFAVVCWNGEAWLPSFGHIKSGQMWNDRSGEFWSGYATHWMPLPSPPA